VSLNLPFDNSVVIAGLLLAALFPNGALAKEKVSNHIGFATEKLGKFSAVMQKGEGKWTCKVVASSGYPDIDSKACEGMTACSVAMEPKFYGTEATAWVKRDPQGYQKEFSAVFGKCIADSRRPIAQEYYARKRAKK
jgi:hypothetical protein